MKKRSVFFESGSSRRYVRRYPAGHRIVSGRALLAGIFVFVIGLPLLIGFLGVGRGLEPPAGPTTRAPAKTAGNILAGSKLVPSWIGICAIQGAGFDSAHEGLSRVTRGIVVADFDELGLEGFFIQDATCDENSNTSNGLFVFLGERINLVQEGDLVQVAGQVHEFFGQTELASSPGQVTVLSQGNPLPAGTELDPPFDPGMARFYFESLEGMLVALPEGLVVGPTTLEGKTWVIDSARGLDRVFVDDPAGTGEVITISGDGLVGLAPPASVGDMVQGVLGVLGYSFGEYQIYLTAPPSVVPAANDISTGPYRNRLAEPPPNSVVIEFATFNVQNLFDPFDDPAKEDPILSPAAYDRKLGKLAAAIHDELGEPPLLALQEVENDLVLADLINRPEIEAEYGYVWLEGPDVRGIDPALLYRKDQIQIEGFDQRQGCTGLADGLGPDGNRDTQNPQNAVTCDLNGDGVLDGNRLFSRPPLVIRAALCLEDCSPRPAVLSDYTQDFWVVVNHWKSKSQDTFWTEYTLPRRLEQAAFVAGLLPELHAAAPKVGVFVIGDLNDYAASAPLAILEEAGLHSSTSYLDRATRYTFIYQGVSQVLDTILFSPALAGPWIEPSIRHINVDYPEVLGGVTGTPFRSADHDPLYARFTFIQPSLYLPVVLRPP